MGSPQPCAAPGSESPTLDLRFLSSNELFTLGKLKAIGQSIDGLVVNSRIV